MDNINISIEWRAALVAEGGESYKFPDKRPLYFRERYCIPAVYRWHVLRQPGLTEDEWYIGEADDVARRIQRVLTPPKRNLRNTNSRLNRLFQERLAAGKTICLSVAEVQSSFAINGITFDQNCMRDAFKRRALENILLVIAQNTKQVKLLNVAVDPIDKVQRQLSRLKPHELREALRIATRKMKPQPDASEPASKN